MYPELEKAGGLSKALDNEFAKANCSLRVSVHNNLDKIPFAYARVEKGINSRKCLHAQTEIT
jgi:hypothetical protein